MQSGALVAAIALLIVAVAANSLYPSSVWFLAACAVGGAFVFLNWHHQVHKPDDASNALYPLLGVSALVFGLLSEIDRPLLINLTCGFSVFGAVLFGLVEIARCRQQQGAE